VRVSAEAELDEKREAAFWSWREHPPMEGDGKNRRAISFSQFLQKVGLGEPIKLVLPNEEKCARLVEMHKRGEMRER